MYPPSQYGQASQQGSLYPQQGQQGQYSPSATSPQPSGHYSWSQGKPEGEVPPQGYPQQGYPQQGYPQQGYPQQGYPQQGYPQQGYPQQGYPQGYPEQQPQQFHELPDQSRPHHELP